MEIDTDHRAVVATVALKIKRSQKREHPAPRYNIAGFGIPRYKSALPEVSNWFSVLAEGVQHDWNTYRDEMNSAAMATLGTVQSTKKDWLTCETLDLIEQSVRQACR